MFSGLMASVDLCRQMDRTNMDRTKMDRDTMYRVTADTPPPIRFSRRKPSLAARNADILLDRVAETLWQVENNQMNEITHRDHALLPADGEDGVVTSWPPRGRIYKDMDCLVHDRRRGPLRKHNIEVDAPEDLLKRVEGEPAQFAFDEIWAILHNSLELNVPVPALPPGDQVQHVGALGGLPVLPASGAGEGDGERREEGQVGGLVAHSEQPCEEVDLAGHRGDSQEAGGAHDEEGEYCLVGKVGVDVGGLLENDDVAPRSFGR